MGLNQMLWTLGAITIFCIAFLNFAVDFGTEQNATINIDSESYINSSQINMQTNAEAFTSAGGANATLDAMERGSIISNAVDAIFNGISIFTTAITRPFLVLRNMFSLITSSIFGEDSSYGIVFNIIVGILVVMIGFLGYKLWKGGNPD